MLKLDMLANVFRVHLQNNFIIYNTVCQIDLISIYYSSIALIFIKLEIVLNIVLTAEVKQYLKMIKPKSKSRQIKQITEYQNRIMTGKRSISKQTRQIHTAQRRNYSNQYIPISHHHFENPYLVKTRQFSSVKIGKKQSVKNILEADCAAVRVHHQLKQKRPLSSKTFIGSKLKRKIMRYLLFLALVNYSLRISYEKHQPKRYKIYVGKGNNSKLVKTIFSSRFWWELTIDEKQANLIWTQKSKKKIFKVIDSLLPLEKKEQLYPLQANYRRKVKSKKKQVKKHFMQQFESVLCEKDRNVVKNQCKKDSLEEDLKCFLKKMKQQKRKYVKITHNHIENHRLLTNKKNLFFNLRQFCMQRNDNIFNYVPLTFHIKEGTSQQYKQIESYEEIQLKKDKEKLLWIVKPGQNSNRGCGIQMCKRVDQVKRHIEKQKQKHSERTFIVQKYISPYLFHRRKFDIRCFVLVTASPLISAYFYPVGYIRTSSYQFSLKNCTNKYIHLTNDAVQKKATEYSKYQNGNKVTFEGFQSYMEMFQTKKSVNFFGDILPAIKQLVHVSIKSANNFSDSSKQHTFQLLGYDFMLDEDLQPWLIEINTNPCLQTGCDILNAIIPQMLQNVIKIAVDPVFAPPKIDQWSLKDLLACSDRLLENNKFELVYSQLHQA